MSGGWYAERRQAQALLIVGLLCAAALGAVFLGFLLRGTLARQGPALVGVALLTSFVMVRAVGFHHIDAMISIRFSGWRMNWILEIGGIALVALGALRVLAALPKPRRPRQGGAP